MTSSGGVRGTLRNLSLKALSLGLERVCRLVVVLVAAPVLGEASFGRFVFANTVTSLLALGTDLGLGVWTTRTLARRAGGDGARRVDVGVRIGVGDGGRDEVVRLGLVLRALAALPYAVAIGLVSLVFAHDESRAAVLWLGVAALGNAFVDHVGAVLRGDERFADEARLNTSRAIATAAFGSVALVAERSLHALCAAFAAAAVASSVYGFVALLRRHRLRAGPGRPALDRALARLALAEAVPIWLAGLLSVLYFKIDTLFMQAIAGDAELGAYGAAYKLFEGSMVVPSIVLSVVFPRLARVHGDRPAQARLERALCAALLGLGLVAWAVAFFAGGDLVRILFGADFARARPSLRVLSFGLPLVYLNYGLTHFLVARDLGRATTRLSFVMLVLNVAINAVLIPRYAGAGAALATVLTEVALTLGCLQALRAPATDRSPTSDRGAARRDRRAA